MGGKHVFAGWECAIPWRGLQPCKSSDIAVECCRRNTSAACSSADTDGRRRPYSDTCLGLMSAPHITCLHACLYICLDVYRHLTTKMAMVLHAHVHIHACMHAHTHASLRACHASHGNACTPARTDAFTCMHMHARHARTHACTEAPEHTWKHGRARERMDTCTQASTDA